MRLETADVGTIHYRAQRYSIETASASPHTATMASHLIFVDTSTVAITVNLPTPSEGLRFEVVDAAGNASAQNITISPASGNINGAATKKITTNWGGLTIICNGTDYFAY